MAGLVFDLGRYFYNFHLKEQIQLHVSDFHFYSWKYFLHRSAEQHRCLGIQLKNSGFGNSTSSNLMATDDKMIGSTASLEEYNIEYTFGA